MKKSLRPDLAFVLLICLLVSIVFPGVSVAQTSSALKFARTSSALKFIQNTQASQAQNFAKMASTLDSAHKFSALKSDRSSSMLSLAQASAGPKFSWTFKAGTTGDGSQVIASGNTVYYNVSVFNQLYRNSLYAVGMDGKQKWKSSGTGQLSGLVQGPDNSFYTDEYNQQTGIETIYKLGANGQEQQILQAASDIGNAEYGLFSPEITFGPNEMTYIGIKNSTDETTTLYALGPDNTKKWEYEINSLWPQLNIGSDGILYVLAGGDINSSLLAIDADGSLKWQSPVGFQAWGIGIGADGTVYVDGETDVTDEYGNEFSQGHLQAFDQDGNEKWEYQNDAEGYLSIAGYAEDGTVYLNTNNFDADVSSVAYALDSEGGVKWDFEGEVLAPTTDKLYAVWLGENVSTLSSLNSEGEALWVKEFSGYFFPVSFDGDGKIYLTRLDYDLEGLSLTALTDDGDDVTQDWDQKLDSLIYSVRSGPDGTIYGEGWDFSDDWNSRLYAFNANGTVKWNMNLGNSWYSYDIANNGAVFVGTSTGKLYAIGDVKPPVVKITAPAKDSVGNQTTCIIKGTVTDDDTVNLKTVNLYINSNDEGEVLVDTVYGAKDFTFSDVPLADGRNTVRVEAIDKAGNVSVADFKSDTRIIGVDTQAPTLVVGEDALNGLDINLDRNGIQTREKKVIISGTVSDDVAAPGQIEVKVNKAKVKVGADGSFSYSLTLKNGVNPIVLTATDTVKNVTSQDYTITQLESKKPTVKITLPAKDLTDNQEGTYLIQGMVSEPSTVTIYGSLDGAEEQELDSAFSSDNKFSFNVSLAAGVNKLRVVAVDLSDNVSDANVRYDTRTITVDTEAPEYLSLAVDGFEPDQKDANLVVKNKVSVTGQISDNMTTNAKDFTVTVNNKKVQLKSDLTFTAPITLKEGIPVEVTVIVKDKAGNETAPVTFTVLYQKAIFL